MRLVQGQWPYTASVMLILVYICVYFFFKPQDKGATCFENSQACTDDAVVDSDFQSINVSIYIKCMNKFN